MHSKDLAVFMASSFALAALADAWFYYARGTAADPVLVSALGLPWVFLRMYTPTAGALLAVKVSSGSIREELAGYLGIRGRVLLYYLAAPLLAYLTVGCMCSWACCRPG